MRIAGLVMALLVASATSAAASCADDVEALNLRVKHAQKSAQTAAAAKELKKLNKDLPRMDEFQCLNGVARVRRALTSSPPDDQAQQKP